MDKYDVFISCKSEDYQYAELIYNFLHDNGINAFLTSKELRKLGESEYRKAITSVLKDVSHIIVFASKAEYIDSRWVYYEWDWFVNAKLKGFKQGNIITILKDIRVDDINADLWKYESLTFDSFKDTVLRYVETEQSRRRREQNREKQQQEKKRREMKAQLVESAEEYTKAAYGLSIKGAKVRDIIEELHIERVCPVCGADVPPSESYCHRCAWPMSPVDGVDDLDYLAQPNRNQLQLHKSVYNKSLLSAIHPVKKTDTPIAETEHNVKERFQFGNWVFSHKWWLIAAILIFLFIVVVGSADEYKTPGTSAVVVEEVAADSVDCVYEEAEAVPVDSAYMDYMYGPGNW